MNELRDLYQEIILDHYKSPKNFGTLEDSSPKAYGDNPLCGDKLAGRIEEVRFKGMGCAISSAAASLMTEAVKGKTREEVRKIYDRFHPMVTGEGSGDGLGKLEVFSGVSEFPVRVKCATLAWHTLRAALEGSQDTESTE